MGRSGRSRAVTWASMSRALVRGSFRDSTPQVEAFRRLLQLLRMQLNGPLKVHTRYKMQHKLRAIPMCHKPNWGRVVLQMQPFLLQPLQVHLLLGIYLRIRIRTTIVTRPVIYASKGIGGSWPIGQRHHARHPFQCLHLTLTNLLRVRMRVRVRM